MPKFISRHGQIHENSVREPPLSAAQLMKILNEQDARIAELEKDLGNAGDLVADMECSCLPYARPGDGMCERCMFFKDSLDGESE